MKPKIRILSNAQVFTGDSARSDVLSGATAASIAIQAGRILEVGSEQAVLAEFGDHADLEDLGGQFILPGLTDAHIHLLQYALSLQKIDCETRTRIECLKRVAE